MAAGSTIVKGILFVCLTFLISLQLFCEQLDIESESIYRVVFASDLGYTLIGEKPISLDELQDFYLHTHPGVRDKFIHSLKTIFKGSKKFVLKVFPFGSGYEIELIHRKSLRALVSKNKYVKKFVESTYSNEPEFYSKIEDAHVSVFDVIKNDFIFGLLFGYGEENARYFCRMAEIGLHLKKFPYVMLFDMHGGKSIIRKNFPRVINFPYVVKIPELGFGFNSLEEEWEWLKSVDFDSEKESKAVPPYFINLPVYLERSGPKSAAVRAKCINAREKLAKLFYGKSYMQAVEDEVRRK